MKPHKKLKAKHDLELRAEPEHDFGRPVPFGALEELISSEVIAEVKKGMSLFDPLEPLEFEGEITDDAA